MDRQIVYAGSIPLDTDILAIQRNMQTALGLLTELVVGGAPLVRGFGHQVGPGAFTVSLLPGSMSEYLASDYRPFGALGPDATPVVRTGRLPASIAVPLGEPSDAAHVLCWLVQVQLSESDEGSTVLPYWNAAAPNVPYSGPGNSGQAQPTTRVLRVAVSAKSSGPQVVGSVVPPVADAGWLGLFWVTTYAGKPDVALSDIVPCPAAPRLRYALPALPPAPTAQVVFTASGSWTAPDQVRWARVKVLGAGGGGGGGDAGYSGGGGGAGGYAEGLIAVEPGQRYSVLVGLGGLGGRTAGTGDYGGPSAFGADIVAASGGEGGASNNPDSHGGSPGQGTAGSLLQAGGYGGDGAAALSVPGGNGGASLFGGGGRGSSEGGVPAFGLAAGSGGGGGYGALSSGGTGAAGLVIVEY